MVRDELTATTVFDIGPIEVTGTVVTTWGLMAFIGVVAALVGHHLERTPRPVQVVAESVVHAFESTVEAVAPGHARLIMPFISTFWIFLVCANLAGLVPGLYSPTGDLSATSGLAILVFLSVHWFGIRTQGLGKYLRHYLTPNPILLPFHVVSEITRTVALAVRLFGNMMSLQMAAMLVLLVAGFLAPVPLLLLHVVEALVQAYIFGMLALIYVAGGLQSQQSRQSEKE